MSELQTISTVSKNLGVSSRTLRYYEQIGLITSNRLKDYAYRVYDENAIRRLRQIIILRKLRVPTKQIREIFDNSDAMGVIEIFERNISELDEQMTALSTIKSILCRLVSELHEKANMQLQLDYLGDSSVFAIVDSLSFPTNRLEEEKSMSELNQANEKLNKLEDRDVRIVYLPPTAVVSSHYIGDEPEHNANIAITKFIKESGLLDVKPDVRQFGFNHPNPGILENGHGYEIWVTIPDDMDVVMPLEKKHFPGGLYAAHMIPMGAFEEWGWLWEWAHNNDKYIPNIHNDGGQCMNGLLEETLNYRNLAYKAVDGVFDIPQLDLLIPIKEREN